MKYFKLILLVFSLLWLPLAANEAWAKDAEITDLRWTARNDGDPPFVRIVTDLTKAVQAEAAIDKSGKNFEVILKNTQKSFSGSQYDMDPRAIDFTTVSEKDGDTYIDVALTKPQKIDDIHVFALRPDAKLGKPHRLVIDIPIQGAKRATRSRQQAPRIRRQKSRPPRSLLLRKKPPRRKSLYLPMPEKYSKARSSALTPATAARTSVPSDTKEIRRSTRRMSPSPSPCRCATCSPLPVRRSS